MKHIRKFEEVKYRDYVKIKPDNSFTESYNIFISENIGQVMEDDEKYVYVNFISNIPKYFNNKHYDHIHQFHKDLVEYYAPTIEELKLKISASKYNI